MYFKYVFYISNFYFILTILVTYYKKIYIYLGMNCNSIYIYTVELLPINITKDK